MIRRLSGKSCWLDVEPVFSGRSADSIFGRQHTRSRINKLYLLAYLHTMALSFFISLFVTYTDIANRQTTNIFFGFLGIHSSDAREKKKRKALTLCRDPTSSVEIKHSAFYPFLKSALRLLNDQPTDKRSFLGGNQKRLRFFTPQRGRIESFGFNFFCSGSPQNYPNP